MPAMNNILSKWVPVAERSRSLALVYSGMYLGSVTGLAFSPFLIHQFGWPSVFYSFGSLGTVWFALWLNKVYAAFDMVGYRCYCFSKSKLISIIWKWSTQFKCSFFGGGRGVFDFIWKYLPNAIIFFFVLQAYSSPIEDPELLPQEKKLIVTNCISKQPVKTIPWKLILSKPPVWALIVSHFCHNWGTFILLTWMPTYYHQVSVFIFIMHTVVVLASIAFKMLNKHPQKIEIYYLCALTTLWLVGKSMKEPFFLSHFLKPELKHPWHYVLMLLLTIVKEELFLLPIMVLRNYFVTYL